MAALDARDIPLHVLSADEQRRATLLLFVKALFPQLGAETSVRVAHYLRTGRWEVTW